MGYVMLYDNEVRKLNLNFKNLDLLELGDQEIHDHRLAPMFSKLRNSRIFDAKRYVVYDLHKREGVTEYDLSEVHHECEKFDVITNFGTTEHVEPELGQYNCWLNIHNMLKPNGIIINIVPCSDGGWEDHCRYYYNQLFFEQFEDIGYNLLSYKVILDKNCFSVLQKKQDNEFLKEEDFWKNLVVRKQNNSDIIYHDNNPKGLKF